MKERIQLRNFTYKPIFRILLDGIHQRYTATLSLKYVHNTTYFSSNARVQSKFLMCELVCVCVFICVLMRFLMCELILQLYTMSQ